MHPGLLLATSAMVPFACLGLLMWLSWLEDTLVEDVKRTERRHVPEPIVAFPVQRAEVTPLPVKPAPAATAAQPEPTPATPATPAIAVAS